MQPTKWLVFLLFFGISGVAMAKIECQPLRDAAKAKAEFSFLKTYDLVKRHDKLCEIDRERAFERFVYLFMPLQAILTSDRDPDKVAKILILPDSRRMIFEVEALARLYRRVDEERFDAIRTTIKRIEDAVSALEADTKFLEFATAIHATQPVLDQMTKVANQSHQSLKNIVKANWTPDNRGRIPAIAEFFEQAFKDQNELNLNKRDRREISDAMIDELKKFRDDDLDISDLEQGLHELRRRLRWIAYYVNALDGVFTLTLDRGQSTIQEYNDMIKNPTWNDTPYLKFDQSGRESSSIALSRPYFVAASKFVDDLGTIKDIAEYYIATEDAYLKLNLASSRVHARDIVTKLAKAAKPPKPLYPDFQPAKTIYDGLLENAFYDGLIDELKDLLKVK